MEITKAKITKDNTLVVTYSDEDGNVITHEGANIVHEDLKNSFKCLIPHLSVLTEQREAYGIDELNDLPDDIYQKLEVSGFTMSGSDTQEGVTLTGKRFLKSKKVLNINTPLTMFDGEVDQYSFTDDLYSAIERVKFEVKEYVLEHKWAVKQASLDFVSNGDNPFEGAPEDISDIPQDTDIKEIKPGKKHKKAKAA